MGKETWKGQGVITSDFPCNSCLVSDTVGCWDCVDFDNFILNENAEPETLQSFHGDRGECVFCFDEKECLACGNFEDCLSDIEFERSFEPEFYYEDDY
jgi:hypothetical protein